MNNEIGRKITSLTLMTIMLAGGMVIASPGMVPMAHAANANLFVSAENSQFDNYMSGPQVIEVVVIDSDINDTATAEGEPDVTINGKKLRMAQATDGNWYGYFADKTMATIADATTTAAIGGRGLDFGQFCGSASTALSDDSTQLFSDTVGVAIPVRSNSTVNTFGVNGTTAIAACNTPFDGKSDLGATVLATVISANSTHTMVHTIATATTSVATVSTGVEGTVMNVVREAKSINTALGVTNIGQIDLKDDGLWPFIQLYNLSQGGNVIIQYNKGGGAQSVSLTFDTVNQFANVSLDRSVYTRDSQVHATVTDLWLNIDPTDEDSWTFDTQAASPDAYYQLFNENGGLAGDTESSGAIFLKGNYSSLMNADSILKVNTNKQSATNPVLTLQDNADTVMLTCTTTALVCTTAQLAAGTVPVTLTEQGPNSGVFGTYDTSDVSIIKITSNAARGTSATIDYNDSPVTVLVGFGTATIDIQATDDEWNSGESIAIVLVDSDANKNSRADEDLDLNDPTVTLIPSLSTGDPFTIGETTNSTGPVAIYIDAVVGPSTTLLTTAIAGSYMAANMTVDSFSQIARVNSTGDNNNIGLVLVDSILIDLRTTMGELRKSIGSTTDTTTSGLRGMNLINYDVRSFNNTGTFNIYLVNSTQNGLINAAGMNLAGAGIGSLKLVSSGASSGILSLNGTVDNRNVNTALFDKTALTGTPDANFIGLLIQHVGDAQAKIVKPVDAVDPIVVDFFSFGFTGDGLVGNERVANQIVRLELEESGDNTSTFEGSLEYIMVNQLNILDASTYTGLTTIGSAPKFIVIEDLTDEDAPRVNYLDLGEDGVSTQIADQQEAPSHSGVVSLDASSYKTADTVIITLEDLDLNVDSDLIDIYTVLTTTADQNQDAIGTGNATSSGFSITLSNGDELGRLLDVTFDDERWQTPTNACLATLTGAASTDTGLGATGFTLVETGTESGIFVGSFQIPNLWCKSGATAAVTATGLDIEVNYVDFRDASGETIEVGDGAGIRANTGSVSLDRTVYPVPFGIESDFVAQTVTTPTGRALFPIHASGMDTAGTTRSTAGLQAGEFIGVGDLTIHVRVNDPDFDLSASGEDNINTNSTANVGPVKVSVIRGSSTVILGYAGGDSVLTGTIDTDNTSVKSTRAFGPMTEIAPDAGIFESDIVIRYTDGPSSTTCPSVTDTWTALNGASTTTETDRFDVAATTGDYCILQGDILQVEYTDPADASGDINTVTDSATFDLRNGVLQSDKSLYIIGSDMILTLIEPDFDLDNDQAETYDLDLIEWDSDAATVTMGDADGSGSSFDPEPLNFRETGDSTGIFQIVIEIPSALAGSNLNRGEEIVLEYSDWGPSGADYVGNEDEDVNLTIFTSNFGATVELDQKVYTWTDKVYITIVAPDHNFDSNLVDEIGNTAFDKIKVSTRGFNIDQYKLVETGTDTGIFTGEVILVGFAHDADGVTGNEKGSQSTSADSTGPTDGLLETDNDDGLTVSFEFSEDETVVGSALIRWNIGEVQWLEASYPASGTGVVRVIDPDMNLDPEAVDNFNADVWSDSDAGGIDLTVTETNEATGIFEGTVFFTTTNESSGHRLRVAEGDTVTAEYEDNTLPDPYTTADELDITATSLIGTVVPPLERAPAANLRTVDAFGNSLDTVSVDQQVQISADLANGQDREQSFAYLVQIQDGNGVTVSLAWITGSLSAGQSFSPALSWIPTQAGTYTATAFVWESVDNPTALSPPVSTTVTVQ